MAEKLMPKVYSVTELTEAIRRLLGGAFPTVDLEGEIINFKRYPSGHAYFTLKDAEAQISAVMFKNAFNACEFSAQLLDGVKIKVRGEVTVYPQRGNYQLVVRRARPVGAGELMLRYEELKRRLEAEGLFASGRKRALPFMPRRIALVTSEAGAVVHDLVTVLTRRFPDLEIRLFPALVQGAGAPPTLIEGIRYFNALADWRADVLILARGGGSYEDLFCFNDEGLVRALAASTIPTVSAVGHETDFTLCDFAADVRAGTPSIAAEIVVPLESEVVGRVRDAALRLATALRGKGEWFAQRLDHLSDSLALSLNFAALRAEGRLKTASQMLEPLVKQAFDRATDRFAQSRKALSLLSPYGVLDRGYALVTGADGKVVRDAAQVRSGDRLDLRLARGNVEATAK